MVIILTDGGVIIPKGNVTPSTWGLIIEAGQERSTIPSSQIKWIYENQDPEKEKTFVSNLQSKISAPITTTDGKSNEQIIQTLR